MAGSRQAGGEEGVVVVVAGGVVWWWWLVVWLVAGWMAGMVHDGKTFGFDTATTVKCTGSAS